MPDCAANPVPRSATRISQPPGAGYLDGIASEQIVSTLRRAPMMHPGGGVAGVDKPTAGAPAGHAGTVLALRVPGLRPGAGADRRKQTASHPSL